VTDCEIVHRILYFALLDIRSRARELNDRAVFQLADLFHNVVLQMGHACADSREYSDVYSALVEQADRQGCRTWLDCVVTQIRKSQENEGSPDS